MRCDMEKEEEEGVGSLCLVCTREEALPSRGKGTETGPSFPPLPPHHHQKTAEGGGRGSGRGVSGGSLRRSQVRSISTRFTNAFFP